MERASGERREKFQNLNGNGRQGINGGGSFGNAGSRHKGNMLGEKRC